MKQAQNDMRVKIVSPFMHPLTRRMLHKGDVINVPSSGFWLKRLQVEDVQKTEEKPKVKVPSSEVKQEAAKPKKTENKSKK